MFIHRNLKYFLRLAETGNYHRASQSLHITHSALVRSIKTMEASFEAKLFNRGGGVQVTLTGFGEIALEYARKISHLEMDLRDDFSLMKGLSKGELSVAFAPYASYMCGHAAVSRLLNKYPGLMIKTTVLHFDRICDVVAKREADLGIAYVSGSDRKKDFVIEDLGQHQGVFFCRPGHPLLKHERLSMTDLTKYPWCCNRLPKAYSQFLPENLEKAGKHDTITGDFIPAVELDLLFGMNDIVAKSDVLGMGMLLMFGQELESGKLSVLPFQEEWMKTRYSIIYPTRRNLSPSALAFIEEVRSIEKEFMAQQPSVAAKFLGEATFT